MTATRFSPNTVIVHGPSGCGKTRNSERIAAHYGCTLTIDSWPDNHQRFGITLGALHLTNENPALFRAAKANLLNFADLPDYLKGADNMFEGTPPAAMAAIERLFCYLLNSEDDQEPGNIAWPADQAKEKAAREKARHDFIADAVDQWRFARGAEGCSEWYWMHRGAEGDDGFWGDYKSREACIQGALEGLADGSIQSEDGTFIIALCRTYADYIDPENAPLADALFQEKLRGNLDTLSAEAVA